MDKRFGRNDVIFLGFLLVFCIAACLAVYSGGVGNGRLLSVTVDGKLYGTYALFQEQKITIQEGDRENVIVIENGKAFMSHASCPDQLCVNQRAISSDKESIICLPNKVVLTVSGGIKNETDIIVP